MQDRRKAPSRTANRDTEWVMSQMRASGAIPNITPRQTAGADAAPPKSVRKEMNGPDIRRG